MSSPQPEFDFQEFYKREGNIWLVKRFQSNLLSALIRDLKQHSKNGIPEEVCSGVNEALIRSVSIVKDIKEGNFFFELFFVLFHEHVKKFQTIYKSWNDADTPRDRIRIREKLIEKREDIGNEITFKMRDIRARDSAEKKKHFDSLKNADKNKLESLRKVFQEFVETNAQLFPQLANAVANNI